MKRRETVTGVGQAPAVFVSKSHFSDFRVDCCFRQTLGVRTLPVLSWVSWCGNSQRPPKVVVMSFAEGIALAELFRRLPSPWSTYRNANSISIKRNYTTYIVCHWSDDPWTTCISHHSRTIMDLQFISEFSFQMPRNISDTPSQKSKCYYTTNILHHVKLGASLYYIYWSVIVLFCENLYIL